MSKFVDRPRYLCALGGAIGTLNALPGVIPILHAAAGCGGNISNALNGGGGYSGSSYCGGQALPSSNVYENEIVFGGEARLEEQIENTLKVVDGELYFVVSGCMVEMIGDDTASVAKRFSRSNKTVLSSDTGGFKGNSYKGYDLVLETLFRDYVEKSDDKEPGTVNLFGIVPVQDVFWKGNLNELKRITSKLGLKVNTFFGSNETLDNLKNAAKASLNIVVSDTFGIDAAKVFEEVHNVPYINTPLPIGAKATSEFILAIGKALGIEKQLLERVIKEEKKYYFSFYERLADIYNDIDLQRYAVIVADSNYAEALTGFLAYDLGWIPELVVITDILDEEAKSIVLDRFSVLPYDVRPKVVFDTDTSSVKRHLSEHWPKNGGNRYFDSFSPAFVLGSAFERDFAEEIGAPHISISFPISNRIVLDRAYAGIKGALSLTEDILSILVGSR